MAISILMGPWHSYPSTVKCSKRNASMSEMEGSMRRSGKGLGSLQADGQGKGCGEEGARTNSGW